MSRLALALGGVGAAAGIAGAVLGGVALSRVESRPAAGSPTVAVSSAAVASDSAGAHQDAAETCAAFRNFKAGVGIARGAFLDRVDRANDWESPGSIGTQGYYFGAVGNQLDYLDARVRPDSPAELVSAIAELRPTLTAVVDADLRREPAAVSNTIVDEYAAALKAVESYCTRAGVG